MVWGFARAPQMDGAAVGAFETISARYACGFARAIPWPLDGRSNAARATRINDLAGGMARFSTGWPNDTDTLGLKERCVSSRSSTVQLANGPTRSMGHVLGAEKDFFLIRGRRPTSGQGGPRRLNPVNPCPRGLPGVA